MSSNYKKIFGILFSFCICMVMATTVFAAKDVSMKKTKVKWDLKPNKTYTVKSKYFNVGNQNIAIKIKNYKKKSVGSKYKVTFDVIMDLTVFHPTKKQVHKMIQGSNKYDTDTVGGWCECYIVDYKSGKNLNWTDDYYDWEWNPWEEYDYYEDGDHYDKMRPNIKGLKIKEKLVKEYGRKNYYDDDGCHVWLDCQKWHYTITYPKSYKGLCVGIGGCQTLFSNKTEEKFCFGIMPFSKLTDYKKKKTNWHFMRIK